ETTALGWWDDDGEILGGRDGQAGGTWLGTSRGGKIAFLTNVREIAGSPSINSNSRGHLPLRFLKSTKSPKEFGEELVDEAHHYQYGGFNLIVADFCSMTMFYITNRPKGDDGNGCLSLTEVSPGIHVLSNAKLDTPWPKAQRLRNSFEEAVNKCGEAEISVEEMTRKLMNDTTKDEDESKLPRIYPPEFEYHLSAIFVEADTALGRYGTRSTSAVILRSSEKWSATSKLNKPNGGLGGGCGVGGEERRIGELQLPLPIFSFHVAVVKKEAPSLSLELRREYRRREDGKMLFRLPMRLFATQSHYRIADAIEAENRCTRQTRLFIDQINMQQGQILALEGKGLKKLVGDVEVPVAAVVVMACDRADYLERTIKSVLKYQTPVASRYPLFISQHLDFEPVHTERPGELIAYYKIAHDMEIAPDFFDYFEAGAALLDSDKSIMAISSWNDNGQRQFVYDPYVLYRSDFFPGLGWMLSKSTWDELSPKWPKAYPSGIVFVIIFEL
ncbi:hypothetical protein RD792_002243, partial [Penstemon davidsonii]